jgi:hypothetical protein
MDTKTIMRETDPNRLRERISQIDAQIGSLQSERLIVDRRFQTILAQNAPKQRDLSIRPDRHERIRNGFEDSCPLNGSNRTVLNGF